MKLLCCKLNISSLFCLRFEYFRYVNSFFLLFTALFPCILCLLRGFTLQKWLIGHKITEFLFHFRSISGNTGPLRGEYMTKICWNNYIQVFMTAKTCVSGVSVKITYWEKSKNMWKILEKGQKSQNIKAKAHKVAAPQNS